MIEFEMKYTPQNLQRAFKLHYKKVFPIRGRILQILGFLLIWIGVLLILIYRNTAHRTINFVYILAGLLIIGLNSYLMGRIGKLTFSRLKNPDQVFTFIIDEDKILMSAGTAGTSIEWGQVQKAIVDKDIIVLYVSKLQFYFMPKENFAAGDFEKCAELVRSKVKVI